MKLDIQMYSFVSSFLFGVILFFLMDIFNILMCKVKLFLKIIFSFLFVMVLALLYFLMLLFINNGVVHFYFLLMILVGYIFGNFIKLCLFTHLRKK